MSRPAIASIHLDHLRHNFHLLKQYAGDSEIMAVVKADAYGHGLELVAPCLWSEGCRNFAVTDASEGMRLNTLLPSGEAREITLLSGIFDQNDARLCNEHTLTPVITEAYQLALLQGASFKGHIWIKIDTGMNRLGAFDAETLIKKCRIMNINIRGLMSHLACADEPDHPMNKLQTQRFHQLCEELIPDAQRSLVNSAGMITMPECRYDVCRPGIALYGSQPVQSMKLDLQPVMQLCAEIMQIRDIHPGESISYGAGFVADDCMRIAVVSLGYGDGLPRNLSNRGTAIHHGKKLPIIGRVCMDYTMVNVTGTSIKEGDCVEFWGPNINIDNIASDTGTISYELLTGIHQRVRRIPV